MRIDQLPEALEKIALSIQLVTSKKIDYVITDAVEADKFPDQIDQILGDDRNGLYVFFSPVDGKIHYVGISNDVVSRFYKHISGGFSWARNGNPAKFPDCSLIREREWLDSEVRELFTNAKFQVKFVIPTEKAVKELLESYLIYYASDSGGKISINVMK
ncbi:GIY-YIG nuclease family protein [Amphibiibacter pelophylacis]|uniref:GIY-YIG nuclease family protein n=1 Tax=Amphibiibacter pelophylacis TaxID=1799477 RepID=A0ACC6NYZ3_9BURK